MSLGNKTATKIPSANELQKCVKFDTEECRKICCIHCLLVCTCLFCLCLVEPTLLSFAALHNHETRQGKASPRVCLSFGSRWFSGRHLTLFPGHSSACTHAHALSVSDSVSLTHMLSLSLSLSHTHTHPHSYSHIHTHSFFFLSLSHTHILSLSLSHTHRHTLSLSLSLSLSFSLSLSLPHTVPHTHTLSHTHTNSTPTSFGHHSH